MRVGQWEYKREDEAESEAEVKSAVLLVGMDTTKDVYKGVQDRQSRDSEWCDMKKHEGNTSCLPRTYENRIITQ